MARRDHSLDGKITSAAMREFMDNGYVEASLRKIAEHAGVTVGAIQTRYPSKDALFVSLLQPLLDDVETLFRNVKTDFYAHSDVFLAQLKSSMQRESTAILQLIFAHYQEAVLLFCCSAGSSMESYFDGIVKQKIGESISFFRSAGHIHMDETLLGLLISVQFDAYRRVIRECPDRQAAEAYMQVLMTYHLGGWPALFDSVHKQQEEHNHEV